MGPSGKDKNQNTDVGAVAQRIPLSQCEPDAIYQRSRYGEDRLVARVADVEVDEKGNEILFGEISESDDLLLPEECQYRNYVCVVRKVLWSISVSKEAPEKGRILRGVTAEILGRLEQ